MKKHPIRHRVERTKNKHSRAVLLDDTIVIRLAGGLSASEEREHISDLLKRMTLQVADEREKIHINPFGRLLDSGESTTVKTTSGRRYCFVLKPGRKTGIRRTRRGWTVIIGPNMRRKGLHMLLWKTLAQAEQRRIEALVEKINAQTFGVHTSGIKLRFASSQWGSCSPRGIIMLNAAMLFVSPEVLRYVIIHELAHRKRADHSHQYWAWVQWAMPGYAKAREKLYDYRLPTLA